MIDKSKTPNLLEDTIAEVNPYEIPEKIWSLIETHFETKYGVEVVEAFPTKRVTKPTVMMTVVKRTPGKQGSKIHGKGANFAKFLKVSSDGYVHELHIQQQEIYIEYSVIGDSSAEVKKIAWDLEKAVLETVGILQGEIEGFQLHFDQQSEDSSLIWTNQDELVRKTIRFKALIPIQYTKLVPELRYIEVIQTWGRILVDNQILTRDSSDKNYYITVEDGQRVVNVLYVFLKQDDGWKSLEIGTDYKLKKDINQLLYIEWNDDYGNVPSVGSTFRVDYELAQLVKGTTFTKSQ